jgi:hypothetical protein
MKRAAAAAVFALPVSAPITGRLVAAALLVLGGSALAVRRSLALRPAR